MGLSQEGLAMRAHVTRQTVHFLEKGMHNPSLKLAFRIARALNSRIEEIFFIEEEQKVLGGDRYWMPVYIPYPRPADK
jgi:putative transcriptional regulator